MLGELLVTKSFGGLIFANDGTKTTILGIAGDYIRIGDAGTTAHSLNSEDDLMVTGELEVKGTVFFDDPLYLIPSKQIVLDSGGGQYPRLFGHNYDVDAKMLMVTFDSGGVTYVPVMAVGDTTSRVADLGFYDGITEPAISAINSAADAYVALDAGDVNGSPVGVGLYFKAATDEDINLLKLSVAGTPTIIWDESEDLFSWSHGIDVPKISYGAEVDLTISSGVIAVTKTYHSIIVDGGAGSADDDLVTATGGSEGDILILKPNVTASDSIDQVTVKDGTGANTFILAGAADFIMDHVDDRLTCIHNGTEWVELTRSSNS